MTTYGRPQQVEGRNDVLVRRVTINGRTYVLFDPTSAAKMLREIEEAAHSGPGWVTIPVREMHQPQVLITAHVDCFIETLEIPDEDPSVDDAAIAFDVDWPLGA